METGLEIVRLDVERARVTVQCLVEATKFAQGMREIAVRLRDAVADRHRFGETVDRLVGVAALKPAEFVIFRIGQKTADA